MKTPKPTEQDTYLMRYMLSAPLIIRSGEKGRARRLASRGLIEATTGDRYMLTDAGYAYLDSVQATSLSVGLPDGIGV